MTSTEPVVNVTSDAIDHQNESKIHRQIQPARTGARVSRGPPAISRQAAEEIEKCITVEMRGADFPISQAENRNTIAVGMAPVLPGIDIQDPDRGPPPAQGHQFLQHELAKVAARTAVDDQVEHRSAAGTGHGTY